MSTHICCGYRGNAWLSEVVLGSNNMHPWVECSNKGICDRETGECECFPGFTGHSCQRTTCQNDCNGRGACVSISYLAAEAGRQYTIPWDALKVNGCLCDKGWRGPDCRLQECPSKDDVMGAFGAKEGRDCSGRGTCNYDTGQCECFMNFAGEACEKHAMYS